MKKNRNLVSCLFLFILYPVLIPFAVSKEEKKKGLLGEEKGVLRVWQNRALGPLTFCSVFYLGR